MVILHYFFPIALLCKASIRLIILFCTYMKLNDNIYVICICYRIISIFQDTYIQVYYSQVEQEKNRKREKQVIEQHIQYNDNNANVCL